MARSRFPRYPDACGWTALLPPRVPRPAVTGTHRVKYAVVGGGYTGLAAARRLAELEPGASIMVLEATTAGEGSAARNSGFVSPRDVPSGATEAELQRGAAQNRLTEEGFGWLTALMERHGFGCELELTGRIKGAATAAGAALVRSQRESAQRLGVPHEFLDAGQMEARIGSRYYGAGLFTGEGYLLQPAALIQGLADCLPGSVALHENSPVTALRRRGQWEMETPEARITADAVVLATNAAVKNFGYLRDRLVTIYTYAALTEAMRPEDAAQLGGMAHWGLLPAHRLGTTVRRVGANRLMVRSMYSYERGIEPDRAHETLLSCFHRRYPALAHVALEHVWGGTTALTMNGAPFWGQIDAGLYTSAGCNGAGIVKGTILGKRLAELMLGAADPQEVGAAFGSANWIAPEPFRRIGFHTIAAVERRRAGAEA
ncbi:MAG: FAD-binding oxidoreductase [Alphaproteobacteria bacterium]|nr:FAD-binding oxidoreductase [Alphaproteobacteria bacterium]